MPTIVNELTIEPKAVPPPETAPGAAPGGGGGAGGGGGKAKPEMEREVEKLTRRAHERTMRLWAS